MSTILSLLPLALLFVFYALFVKLGAKLYKRSQLPWKHAFAFGAIAILVGGVGALLNFATGSNLGPVLAVVLGLVIQLALGGWYLGPRTIAPSGQAIEFKGGVAVAAIAYALVFLLGVVAAVLVPLLAGKSQA
ncbi:hypothetical protein [Piscinibacter defluvii]|uniref:hypothetical protein n=1 Tax=Piscinibacter defluvii TaxID=1796922 RepID=UPI000FDE3689|nr:hypothetical protein [Piscinibacter defluvii]